MKIKTRLILLFLTFSVLIAGIGLVTAETFSRINKEIKESHDVNLMIKDMFDLNMLTNQYMMHHEKRMQQQWLLKYGSFGKLLDRVGRKESHSEYQPILAGVMTDYNALGILFSQLQTNFAKRKSLIKENRPKIEINMTFTLEERLIAQTLMRAQKIVSGAFEVSDVIQKSITWLQERTNLSYSHLTSEERYVISHLVLYGLSLREIGRRLNRRHTTIIREIKRFLAIFWCET